MSPIGDKLTGADHKLVNRDTGSEIIPARVDFGEIKARVPLEPRVLKVGPLIVFFEASMKGEVGSTNPNVVASPGELQARIPVHVSDRLEAWGVNTRLDFKFKIDELVEAIKRFVLSGDVSYLYAYIASVGSAVFGKSDFFGIKGLSGQLRLYFPDNWATPTFLSGSVESKVTQPILINATKFSISYSLTLKAHVGLSPDVWKFLGQKVSPTILRTFAVRIGALTVNSLTHLSTVATSATSATYAVASSPLAFALALGIGSGLSALALLTAPIWLVEFIRWGRERGFDRLILNDRFSQGYADAVYWVDGEFKPTDHRADLQMEAYHRGRKAALDQAEMQTAMRQGLYETNLILHTHRIDVTNMVKEDHNGHGGEEVFQRGDAAHKEWLKLWIFNKLESGELEK